MILKYKAFLVAISVAIALTVVSCKKDKDDSSTTSGGGTTSTPFTGTWTGTSLTANYPTTPSGCNAQSDVTFGMILVLTQSGSTITGTIDFLGDADPAASLPPITVSGSSTTFTLSNDTCTGSPGGTENLTLTLTLSGTTMTATFAGTACEVCTTSDNEAPYTIDGGGTLTK